MKTNELTKNALNWAMAMSEGLTPTVHDVHGYKAVSVKGLMVAAPYVYLDYAPSNDWSQGGPIIEREGISIVQEGDAAEWVASMYDYAADDWHLHTAGHTPLIAAMRCYVASKLGDEVEVPEELAC